MNRKTSESSPRTTTTSPEKEEEIVEWEMRPGGMLVQKRIDNPSSNAPAAPTLRLRIVYGVLRYEISINSQATFGELKKLLTANSGLQPDEQKVLFRGKERQNGEYLDRCGAKNRSKVILTEDPQSKEKRFIEMRRNAKIQSVHRAISDVSMEIDKLVEQVSAVEKSIANGNKVAEVQITTLIEMLMRQAVKLDCIPAQAEACAQIVFQGKRVQKCVETLDVLKVSNTRTKPAVVSTKWETFDPPLSTAHWELFD